MTAGGSESARSSGLAIQGTVAISHSRLLNRCTYTTGQTLFVRSVALALSRCKWEAETQTGRRVRMTVLAVPSGFSPVERRAAKDACLQAGLHPNRIVTIPVAAALGCGLHLGRPRLALLSVSAARSTDLALLRLGGGNCRVIACCGNRGIFESVAAPCGQVDQPTSGAAPEEINDLFSHASLEAAAVEELYLVGQAPALSEMRRLRPCLVGNRPSVHLIPAQSIPLGAATMANLLSKELPDFDVSEALPSALGIEVHGGLTAQIVPRFASLPIRRVRQFSGPKEPTSPVDIHLLQGDRALATENLTLGHYQLDPPPIAPPPGADLQVALDIDAEGLVRLFAGCTTQANDQDIARLDTSALSSQPHHPRPG